MVKIITKTLAEIYLQQGHLEKAYEIYKTLYQKNPFDNEIFQRLNDLEEKLGLQKTTNTPFSRSKQEKIEILRKWLENIKKRRIKEQ